MLNERRHKDFFSLILAHSRDTGILKLHSNRIKRWINENPFRSHSSISTPAQTDNKIKII